MAIFEKRTFFDQAILKNKFQIFFFFFFFLLYLGKPSLMLMYNIVVCVNVIEQCSRYMGSMHASHGGDGQRAVA